MVEFLFSGRGRVRRRDYALAGLFLIVAPLVFAALGLACVFAFGDQFPALGAELEESVRRFVVLGLRRFDVAVEDEAVAWIAAVVAILPLVAVGSIATVWSFFALTAKRLHDAGATGWIAALVILPGLGAWMLYLILVFVPGQAGSNRYGADPRLASQATG